MAVTETITPVLDNGGIPFSLIETQRAFKKAIGVSTPLVGISSPDPAATIKWGMEILGEKKKHSIFFWDVINGLTPGNKESKGAFDTFIKYAVGGESSNSEKETREEALARTANLPELLKMLTQIPSYTIVFIHNAHLFFQFEPVIQGLWNLRDIFKIKYCSIVMLSPSFSNVVPAELVNDIVVIDEELPTREVVTQVVNSQFKTLRSQLKGQAFNNPDEQEVQRIVNYLTGMSTYAVEQRFALSVTKDGMDYRLLAAQKKQSVEVIPGLKYEQWAQKFNDIGGLTEIINFLKMYMNGNLTPRVLIRLDEMEKYFGGTGGEGNSGDTSGVSQDALGVVLSTMEDYGMTGIILAGVHGSGKSLISKALAGEYGLPLITQDIGAARGSLVGQSERNIRMQMKVIRGMSGEKLGGGMYIATCNKLSALPPELKRRFKLQIWFFDLPTPEELIPIWDINLRKYGLKDKPLDEQNLTGSDVANICQLAYALNCPIVKARDYIQPIAVSDREAVTKLRNMASGKFLSASYAGVYQEPSAKLMSNNERGMDME